MITKQVQNERHIESLYFWKVIEVIMIHLLGQFWLLLSWPVGNEEQQRTFLEGIFVSFALL